MKRIGLCLCLFLTLAMFGCHSKPDQVVLKEENNSQTIHLKKEGELVVKLEGNITTGYNWSVQELETQYLQQQGEEEYKSDSKLIGAGGISTFTFEAVQPGQTTLKLIYSRPFEKDTPPEKTFEVTVVVE